MPTKRKRIAHRPLELNANVEEHLLHGGHLFAGEEHCWICNGTQPLGMEAARGFWEANKTAWRAQWKKDGRKDPIYCEEFFEPVAPRK